MTHLRTVVLLAAMFALLACKETTSSKNIRTGGIAMLTTVTAKDDAHARVRTELRVGGDESNTYVLLQGEDNLVASADGKGKDMEAVEKGVYEAEFDVADEDTLFEVKLTRGKDDVAATHNSGKLPAPFDITSDFGNDPISRLKDSMEITWDPSDKTGDMTISFDDKAGAGCIFSQDDDIPGDSGSYVVKPKTLDSTDDKNPESCDVTATIARTGKGSSDEALDNESKFTLRQQRSVTFVSAP